MEIFVAMNVSDIIMTVGRCSSLAQLLIRRLTDMDPKIDIQARTHTHFRVLVTGTGYELWLGFPVDKNGGTTTSLEIAIYHEGEKVSVPELGYDEFQYFENPEYSDILSEIYRLRDALSDALSDVDEQASLDELVGPDISELELDVPDAGLPSVYVPYSSKCVVM